MITWLTVEDIEAMELDRDRWYHLEIEYDARFGWATVKVNDVYWGILFS